MHIHLLVALAAAAMSPGSFEDLDRLDARVAAMLGGVRTAAPIDRRIKLAACPQDADISPSLGGALAIRCPALGWKIRVPVGGIAASDAPLQILVHKGDTIELVAEGPGYSASFTAIALEDGGSGSAIRVKIPTSISPISAIVARAGVATISD